MEHFVITGSGRCGTRYAAELLTRCGVSCGHEATFHPENAAGWRGVPLDWGDRVADASWMAAPHVDILTYLGVPVILLVRDPLEVVRSLVELAFFSSHPVQRANPCHNVLRTHLPWIYEEYATEHDRALAMWVGLTKRALSRAELVIRFADLVASPAAVVELLRWAGRHDAADSAPDVHAELGVVNRHTSLRHDVGSREYAPRWSDHDPALAREARRLVDTLDVRHRRG